MAKNKTIMGWSKCTIEMGTMGEAGAMGLSLSSIGKIKDKSTTLEASDGESLQAYATGHELVAQEDQDGDFILKTRVIEPTDEFYTTLGLGTADETPKFNVKTHVVEGDFSVKVTPKNIGATGIEAPCCHVKFRPGFSEEEGHYADLEYTILKGEADYWYSRFKKA